MKSAPFVLHSLELLFVKTNDFIKLPIDIIIKKLDQLYIDARYPGDFGLLPDGKPDLKEAIIFQQNAEKVYSLVKNFLK